MGEFSVYNKVDEENLEALIADMKDVAKRYPHDIAKEIAPEEECGRGIVYQGFEIDLVLTFQDLAEAGHGWNWSISMGDHSAVPNDVLDKFHRIVFNGELNSPVGSVIEIPRNPIFKNHRQYVMVDGN